MRDVFHPVHPSTAPPAWRWLLALIAVLGFLLSACQPGSAEDNPDYDPDDVVYDQPLHGIYDTGPSRTSVAYPSAGDPQPRVEAAKDFADLGRVALGQRVERTFVIRNAGDSTLTITRLYTTCDYMFADLTASVIPPERIALLVVTLDLTQSPNADIGLVRRGAVLESNDPQRPETIIWVQARIQP